jgi:hypothetical protein
MSQQTTNLNPRNVLGPLHSKAQTVLQSPNDPI